MLNKLVDYLDDWIFTIRFKGLVKEVYSDSNTFIIAKILSITDQKYFLKFNTAYSNKLVLEMYSENVHVLINNIDTFIEATEDETKSLNFIKNNAFYKLTLFEYCLNDKDQLADMIEVLEYLKDSYIKISNFLHKKEDNVVQGYYIRKLELINHDTCEILKALAIFKKNT